MPRPPKGRPTLRGVQPRPLPRCGFRILLAATALTASPLGGSLPARAQAAPADRYAAVPGVIATPDTLREAIPLDQVRVGMRGYGLSVFHGTTIEPFAFEVRTVVQASSPGRAVVWVSCTDDRMQKYGPVQGMSGSPMYIWDEGEEEVLGQGGRLLGAFAFGYAMTNECMVGVQPIEYMRAVGSRVDLPDDGPAGLAGGRNAPARLATEVLSNLLAEADSAATAPWGRTGLDLAADVARRTPGFGALRGPSAFSRQNVDGPRPLALPVALGSEAIARVARPFFEPLNLAAVSAATGVGGVGGPAPSNVDVASTRIEPGSVLAIPLTFGDWTPSAAGTVTDVGPDGTVLGFGHAMDGQGDTALPMASGFTHFVVSRRDISFKQSGLLQVAGSVLQDETTAVAGNAERAFRTAPSRVSVSMPGHPDRSYAYDVVQHPGYAPFLAPLTAVVSLGAEQAPPENNTTHATGRIAFNNGTHFDIDIALPFGTPAGLAFELGPPMTLMLTNPFDDLELVSMDIDLKVDPEVQLGFLNDASVQPAIAEPGDMVELSVVIQPFNGPARTERIPVRIPPDAIDGALELTVSDASTALFRLQAARPAWNRIDSLEELREQLQRGLTLERQAIHVSISGDEAPETTLGQSTLPGLPNTFAAVLATPASSAARNGRAVVQQQHAVPEVVAGRLSVVVEVRRDASAG